MEGASAFLGLTEVGLYLNNPQTGDGTTIPVDLPGSSSGSSPSPQFTTLNLELPGGLPNGTTVALSIASALAHLIKVYSDNNGSPAATVLFGADAGTTSYTWTIGSNNPPPVLDVGSPGDFAPNANAFTMTVQVPAGAGSAGEAGETGPAGPGGECTTTQPAVTQWTKIIDQNQPFDLIVFLSKDYDKYADQVQEYATARNSKLVKAGSAAALVDAVQARYTQLNRKLRVLFVGHGNDQYGPEIGGSNSPDQRNPNGTDYERVNLFNLGGFENKDFTDPEFLKQYFAGAYKDSLILKLKGKIDELTFSACETAEEPGAQKLLDAIRVNLGISKITAGKKELGPVWIMHNDTLVTQIYAREDDGKTPVKTGTADADVLYISQGK